jgi:RNA polymerase-interacting CarD/CdnL/TRCF family regulator
LVVLDDHRGELFIPIDKAQTVGVRQLLARSEIPKLLDHLKTATGKDDWKQRALDNSRRFASGQAFDIAKVVGSLSGRKKTKVLSLSESRILERAKRLLICEVSEVMGETRTAAEEQIDKALEARKPNRN